MRKTALLIALVAVLALPIFADWRLDLGVIVPRGAGMTIGGETETVSGLDVAEWPFIPLPEAGIYYEGKLEDLTIGIGARAFSFILASIVWPNAFAEINLDRVAIQLQVGGGAFGFLTIAGSSGDFGKVLVPDLSAWVKVGKNRNLRLGGGVIGLYLPELLGESLPFLIYLGGKVAIPL